MTTGNDTRRWLIRKAMPAGDEAPFDSVPGSILGPNTDPVWLMTVAEHERQLAIAQEACKHLARTAVEIDDEFRASLGADSRG